MNISTSMRCMAAGAFLALATAAAADPIELILSEVGEKESNQPDDIQCIIYGNSCPPGIQDMAALNYEQSGNQTSFNETSDPDTKGSGETGSVIPDYTVAYLESFVGRVFDIGIDVNTAGGHPAERLLNFEVLVSVADNIFTTAFKFMDGPASLDPNFNGNGYFDFLLSTVDLTGYAGTTLVRFKAEWDQASDGAENFFVVRRTSTQVSEPATLALMLGGLALLGVSRRRRKS